MRIRLAGAALVAATIAGCGGSAPSRPARTVALWSRRSGQRYRLVVKRPGARAHDAPVAPAGFPFDVNLGTDGRGRATAVYSRCAVGAPEHGYPYEHREDCRLFAFDVATGAERPLAELHARGRSEVRPAIHDGLVAFARGRELHEADARATILVARIGSGRPPRRLRSFALTGEDSVLGMDIDRGGVAVALDLPTEPGSTALYLARPGGPLRKIAAGGSGEENRIMTTSPTFAGGDLYWALTNRHPYKRPNGMVMRRDLETGFTAGAEAPGYLTSVAADPRRPGAPLLAASDADANCPPYTHGRQRLHRLRHLQFQLRPLQPW